LLIFISNSYNYTTCKIFTLTFRSLPETFIKRKLFISCHSSDVTWQDIGRMCGSLFQFTERFPSFRMCTASLIHLVLLSDSLSKTVDSGQLITWSAWSVKADLFCSDWSTSTILDRESDRSTRWIKEAVHIQKEGRRPVNRDEGSYTLSHTYDVPHHITTVARNFVQSENFCFPPNYFFIFTSFVIFGVILSGKNRGFWVRTCR